MGLRRWWRAGKVTQKREWFVLLRFPDPAVDTVWFQARDKGFRTEEQAKKWAREFVAFAHDKFDTVYEFKIKKEPYVHASDRV